MPQQWYRRTFLTDGNRSDMSAQVAQEYRGKSKMSWYIRRAEIHDKRPVKVRQKLTLTDCLKARLRFAIRAIVSLCVI